jgi:hypothetical protein
MSSPGSWLLTAWRPRGLRPGLVDREAARLKPCPSTIVSTSIKLTELGKSRQSLVASHRSLVVSRWLRTSGAEQRYALALSSLSCIRVHHHECSVLLRCAQDERALFAQGENTRAPAQSSATSVAIRSRCRRSRRGPRCSPRQICRNPFALLPRGRPGCGDAERDANPPLRGT